MVFFYYLEMCCFANEGVKSVLKQHSSTAVTQHDALQVQDVPLSTQQLMMNTTKALWGEIEAFFPDMNIKANAIYCYCTWG